MTATRGGACVATLGGQSETSRNSEPFVRLILDAQERSRPSRVAPRSSLRDYKINGRAQAAPCASRGFVSRQSASTARLRPPIGMPPADRRAAYKNTLDKDDARRGREETTISLRKDKRQEQLQKRRCGQGGAAAVGGAAGMATPEQTSVGSQAWAESDPQKLDYRMCPVSDEAGGRAGLTLNN